MSLDHLWAGWRRAYIESMVDPEGSSARSVDAPDSTGGSLFERILALPDDEGYVVHRGEHVSALLNAYPYASGHVLVLPNRAAADLADLRDDEAAELWREAQDAVTALRAAYRCDGVNLGMNLGRAGGAGVPDHLHVHLVPRWDGDTNFMTTVAGARVMPEPLDASWRKLRDAWPVRDTGAG